MGFWYMIKFTRRGKGGTVENVKGGNLEEEGDIGGEINFIIFLILYCILIFEWEWWAVYY